MLLLPIPILWARRYFQKIQARLLELGADEGDIALLQRSFDSVLTICFLAFYLCLLGVVGYQ
jgi:hypothetical protein